MAHLWCGVEVNTSQCHRELWSGNDASGKWLVPVPLQPPLSFFGAAVHCTYICVLLLVCLFMCVCMPVYVLLVFFQ